MADIRRNSVQSTGPRRNSQHSTAPRRNSHQSTSGRRRSSAKSVKAHPVQTIADRKKLAQDAAAQMEHLLSSRNPTYVLNYLEKKTQFDKEQIKALQKMYRTFKGTSQMDRLRYREMVSSLLGITDNMMLDRIFQAFDGDNEGSVSENEWILGLSVQLKGTLDQQIAYTYDVYDVNGDRSIGRDEISSFYRNCMHAIPGVIEPEELDEATNELVEIAMRKFDINRDGNISFSEYRHIIKKDPLLLEPFGECLPKDKAALTLMGLLDVEERNFKSYLSRPGDIGWTAERQRYIQHELVGGGRDPHHVDFVRDPELDDAQLSSPQTWSTIGFLVPNTESTISGTPLMKKRGHYSFSRATIQKGKPLKKSKNPGKF